jgi:hypothetical protein
MSALVLSPHYPDVLALRSKASKSLSAPPGSHAVPPARSCATQRMQACGKRGQ